MVKANNGPFQKPEDLFQLLGEEHEMLLGLNRMEWVLEKLGNPQRRLKAIHVAGTNGKGSTSTMIASVLKEAGYSVGTYISPPMSTWNERIQMDGQNISEKSFVHWANYIWPFVEEMKEQGLQIPSHYEFWTLVAFCYFAYEATPWFTVFETGLGGKYDATNVLIPLVSVITSIGLDHREQLGDTVEQIAAEKAGIIKPGVPVICGDSPQAAIQVIKQISEQQKSNCYVFAKDFNISFDEWGQNQQEFNLQTPYRYFSRLSTPLLQGQHQSKNAATAVMALEVLRQRYASLIEVDQVEIGLSKAYILGRIEQIQHKPIIILDGAHNVDSIQACVDTLQNVYTYRRLIVVTAMMKDKELEQMLPMLTQQADMIVTTEISSQSRSLSAEQLAELASRWMNPVHIYPVPQISDALDYAKSQTAEDDLLLVTGSLYLVAEAHSLLT